MLQSQSRYSPRDDHGRSHATGAAARCALLILLGVSACAPLARRTAPSPSSPPSPTIIPGSAWRAEPPVGHDADAVRRNLRPGDGLRFGRFFGLSLREVTRDSSAGGEETAHFSLQHHDEVDRLIVAEGEAARWGDYRIGVLAIRAPGELGGGLVELEVARLASLPAHVARSDSTGGAEMRLRIPHEITHVTLHHSGSPEPLRPEDDPVEKLRGLQRWGRTDRNWWDVPYHFLIDLDGRVYEGRDWRYMGETNTTYDPRGHLLISVLGNYDIQRPTAAQLEVIADLMAWAVARFDVPLDHVGGHYDYASTSCPGEHLRGYLEDGTFRRGILKRLP